ncbi:hypothetical protein [Lentzea californiensis]|uniref:hypothetical protein n=1 Tax=Lentzea californiensis TaxID=438851 RepID=UPI00216428BE|nr:hypothetical protein [Lentzea californiensis]
MAAQHAYREGNQWGMTVPELLEDAVAEGRPLHLEWSEDGTTWDWPGNNFDTIEMPVIIPEMLAATTPELAPDRDDDTEELATATAVLQVDQSWWFTGPAGAAMTSGCSPMSSSGKP